MTASDRYFELTEKKHLYNIMPLENIPSVLKHGIVCFDEMKQIDHSSIAMNEVQELRNRVEIPNGYSLHQYANLYFSYRNPMLYKRKDIADKLCILAISSEIMDLDGCVVADRNAATSLVRFFPPLEGMDYLDFETIHDRYWTDENPIIQREKKQIKCAEVLIPYSIPPEYITDACVFNKKAQEQLEAYGFNKKITISRYAFFR